MLLLLHLQLLPWQLLAREKHYFNCLFSFCGESSTPVSDWTHLSGRFRDWEFSFSNFQLNSQLQSVDLGSTFDNLETCFSGLVWSASSLDRTYRKKKPGYGPGVRFSKVPVTFRVRNQIFKSKYKE